MLHTTVCNLAVWSLRVSAAKVPVPGIGLWRRAESKAMAAKFSASFTCCYASVSSRGQCPARVRARARPAASKMYNSRKWLENYKRRPHKHTQAAANPPAQRPPLPSPSHYANFCHGGSPMHNAPPAQARVVRTAHAHTVQDHMIVPFMHISISRAEVSIKHLARGISLRTQCLCCVQTTNDLRLHTPFCVSESVILTSSLVMGLGTAPPPGSGSLVTGLKTARPQCRRPRW